MLKGIFFAASVFLAGAASAQDSLRLSFHASENDLNWVRYIKPFIDEVNADPSGALKITGYPNGTLGKALPQQAQMVLDGVTDITFVVPNIASGRFPDDTLFELPGLIRDLEEGTRLYEALLEGNHLRGYEPYEIIGSFMNVRSYLYSRKEVKSIEDMKGLRVRMIGAVGAQIAKGLGMIPIQLPPAEVIEALGRGTIDATTSMPLSLVDFGMDRVTSHDFMLPMNSNSFVMLMSKERFTALSPEAQAVLKTYSGKHLNKVYIEQMSAANADVTARFKSEGKRDVVEPSAEDQAKAEEIFAKVIADWESADPRNADLLKTAQTLLSEIRK